MPSVLVLVPNERKYFTQTAEFRFNSQLDSHVIYLVDLSVSRMQLASYIISVSFNIFSIWILRWLRVDYTLSVSANFHVAMGPSYLIKKVALQIAELQQLGSPSYNHLQKLLEKLSKLRKSFNHKRNINRIYNEKLHYNCLKQLPTLRLNTLGNLGKRK